MATSSPAGGKAPTVAPDPVPAIVPDIIEADDDTDSAFGSEGGGSSYNYGSVTCT